MRKYLTFRNAAIVAAIVLAGGLWLRNRAAAAKKTAEVKTATVQPGDVRRTLVSSGAIVAGKEAKQNFPTAGKLAYVGVAEGDKVSRGTVLMSLDTTDLQTAVTKAWYQYLAADANAKKVEDDLKGKDSTETFAEKNTRVAAQTARDSAYDTWLTAKRAVTNAALFAPFDGIVTSMTTTAVGDTVGITDGVTVIDPTSTYFQMDVDESDVGKMSIGKPVTVTLDAFSGQKFDGSIAEIGYVSKLSSTGATVYSVKVKLPAEIEAKVRIGMNGDGEVVLGESKNVLQLPAEAVIDSQVILPGKEGKKIKIETGLEGDNNVEIKSGLKAGDVVVIK